MADVGLVTEETPGEDDEAHWSRTLLTWAGSNVATVVTVSIAIASVIRLTAVSHGDAATAMAVLHYGGTTEILAAVVIGYVPTWVGLGTFVGFVLWFRQRTWSRALPMILFASGALTLTNVATVALFVVLAIAVVVFYRAREIDSTTVMATMLGALTFPIATGLFADSMWRPAERLTVAGKVSVGYVLGRDGDQLVLMEEASRAVEFVNASAVTSRRICTVNGGNGWFDRAFEDRLPDLVTNRDRIPHYPGCPRT